MMSWFFVNKYFHNDFEDLEHKLRKAFSVALNGAKEYRKQKR